ncbi:srg family chemoreceptor domain-containing protein [Ditylenchus destructor]|nr:srg family chemoreceptor domain-containing protein [Ditylenchus destructor]
MSIGAFLSTHPLPPFIIALVISIPSLILYVVEVIVLIKYSSQFKSAFFRLFVLRFILNFFNFFCSFVYARFGLVGFFMGTFNMMPKWFIGICFFYNYYNFHAENLSTFFILLNRLTSVLMPFKHKEVWSLLLPISFLVILLTPLSFTFPMVGYNYYVHPQLNDTKFTVTFEASESDSFLANLNSSFLAWISSVAFCGICGFMNVATIIAYNATSDNRTTLSDARKAEQRIERRLTVYAIVTFLAQLCYAIWMTLIHVACCILGAGWDQLFLSTFNQLPWVNDFSTIVVPAWVMLWASEPMRRLTKKELGIDKLPFAKKTIISVAPTTTVGWLEKLDETKRVPIN